MKKSSILFTILLIVCFTYLYVGTGNSLDNTNYQKFKIITINSSSLPSDIINFPLLVSIVDPDFNNCQGDGDDITFWNTNFAVQYNHEVDYFNKSTGELIAWIQIPHLSSTANTSLRIYYENPLAENSQNPQLVWEEYEAVYHLTNGNDSAKLRNLTKVGTVFDNTSGKFGPAQEFDGYGNDYLFTNTNFQINTSFTVACWIKIEKSDEDQTFITTPHSLTGVAQRLMLNWSRNNALARNYNISGLGVNTYGESPINDGEWHYLVQMYDNTTNKLYIDGVLEGSTPHSGILRCEYNSFFIGREGNYTHPNWQETVMDGLIDEVRVSSSPISAQRITAEWKNYHITSEFYEISEEYRTDQTAQITSFSFIFLIPIIPVITYLRRNTRK